MSETSENDTPLFVPRPSRTRAEHLQWCKDRALEYADQGDLGSAMASMGSDLSKHPDTANHGGMELFGMLALAGQLRTAGEIREFIEGFN